jgi:hypothetical protein
MIIFPRRSSRQGDAAGLAVFTADPLRLVAAGSLVPGFATVGRISTHSVAVTAADATGGTAPCSYQWQFNWPRDSIGWRNATGSAVTTRAAIVQNLGAAAAYQIRLKFTDSASAVAYSNLLIISTLGRRCVPSLFRGKVEQRDASGWPLPVSAGGTVNTGGR